MRCPPRMSSEVIHVPAVARVPQSPASLLGLANLRGTVLPLVGLRELLGSTDASTEPIATKAIVLDAGTPLALAVDSVESLVTIAADRIEVRESELGAQPGELLRGAFRSGSNDEAAKILDIKRLLGGAFEQHARPARQARVKAAAADQRPATIASTASMLVTFEVAGQEFALELASVQEILPAPAVVVAVPRAEALVVGVTSLRDRLLPLLSLRGLLGFPPAPAADGREKVVVMKVGGAQVGLVADRARAIVAAPAVEHRPDSVGARGAHRRRSAPQSHLSRRARSPADIDPHARATVPGGRHAAARSRTERKLASNARHCAATKSNGSFSCSAWATTSSALPIDAVDEVGEVPAQITRLPKTPKFLEGVVNLRGDVLPVVDQRRRFDMPTSSERRPPAPRRRRDRAPPRGLDRRQRLRRVARAGKLGRAAARPDGRHRPARSRRDQPRAVAAHRAGARSRRAPDARRTRASGHLPEGEPSGCVIKVLVVDDSALVRKLFGARSRERSRLRGRVRARRRSRRWSSSRSFARPSSRSTCTCRR